VGVSGISYGQDGTLYVGGAFTSIGSTSPQNRVATWSGETWARIGDVEQTHRQGL